jgi:SAM-dependent methyltransferase
MTNLHNYTEQNRRAWDEIAQQRHATMFPPAAFFAEGGSVLEELVTTAAGDVRGLRLLHLQCSTGSDTISWAVLGAQATGVDISPRQIEIAQHTADEAGLSVHFVAADVYALPADLQAGDFDIVYTGGGAIVWLPDIVRWAEIVAAALRPGGRIILEDEHPLASCIWIENGQLILGDDYFARQTPSEGAGWSHFGGGETAQENKYQFAWPLGDVITALAKAGLVIDRLEEYPSSAQWRFGAKLGEAAQIPGEYLLLAHKTG